MTWTLSSRSSQFEGERSKDIDGAWPGSCGSAEAQPLTHLGGLPGGGDKLFQGKGESSMGLIRW